MRFMALVKATKDSEAGVLPDEQQLIDMGKFNAELVHADVLLAGDGLQASSKGSRIKFEAGGKKTVSRGPFPETKDLISGYWIVQMTSMDEAIEWFSRCPLVEGEIEVRQLFESADFEPAIGTDEGRATMDAEREFRQGSSA